MDPITAISLASNVVSFVQFASDLVKSTREIHASASGSTTDVTSLDYIYGRLRILSDDLKTAESRQSSDPESLSEPSTSLETHNVGSLDVHGLAILCKADCDSLLDITRKLKSSATSTSTFLCFRIALKKAWKQRAITELEQRLGNIQATITLHICTAMSKLQSDHTNDLQVLRRRSEQLQADQRAGLESISNSLEGLKAALEHANNKHPTRPFTVDEVREVEQMFNQMSLSESHIAKEQKIIKSLTFESLPFRYEAITDAHRNTFEWALDAECYDRKVGDRPVKSAALKTWLMEGEGVFWVSGKPGSGKSTFMKFISEEPRTADFLSKWASPKTAVSVSHYFWNGGTPMQRSLHGLLQTLLYEIVRKCPDTIPIVCPDHWVDSDSVPWTIPALKKSFEIFVNSCMHIGTKFCFFIDGLDEHEGDHLELCKILNGFAKSTNVKICLSSRPWNVFDEAFGQGTSKLHVHELTEGDIRNYAASCLRSHSRWNLAITNAQDGQWLIEQITERAWGVFLWAVLVTKLLLSGLTNRDRFSDMRRRLDSIPIELEPFFMKILTSVEPFYRSKMATTLLIALSAAEPLHFLFYEFHDQEYDDREYALQTPLRPMTKEELSYIRASTAYHLDSRTRGLLELPAKGETVAFLHRTVVDFLNKEDMKRYLRTQVAPDLDFCVQLSLVKASLAYLKGTKPRGKVYRIGFGKYEVLDDVLVGMDDAADEDIDANGNGQVKFYRIMRQALGYGASVDAHNRSGWNKELTDTFDEMERVLTRSVVKNDWNPEAYFREQLVILRAFNHLERKVIEDPTYVQSLGSNLVVYLLEPGLLEPSFIDPEKTALYCGEVAVGTNANLFRQGLSIVQRAVEGQGIDLARIDDDNDTAWSNLLVFLDHLDSFYRRLVLIQLLENDIFMTLLQQGADPNASLKDRNVMGQVAWATFLSWSVDISPVEKVRAAYLRTMRGFLEPDVDLASTTWTSSAGDLDFEKFLPDPRSSIREDAPSWFDPSFLCAIASMLVRKAESSAFLVKKIQDAVQEVLGPNVYDSLISEHPDLVPMSRRKRKWNGTVLDEEEDDWVKEEGKSRETAMRKRSIKRL